MPPLNSAVTKESSKTLIWLITHLDESRGALETASSQGLLFAYAMSSNKNLISDWYHCFCVYTLFHDEHDLAEKKEEYQTLSSSYSNLIFPLEKQ